MIGGEITVTDTTNINELTGQSEKQRATLSLVELDLRDYFAAKFAAAMMTATSADHDLPNIGYRRDASSPTFAERVATIAYRMADAMLRAREEEE
jgi:hypothetical protein